MRIFEERLEHSIGEGELVAAGPDDQRILLTRVEGKVCAIDLWCSHEQVDLSTGVVIGHEVFCPRHFSSFDVRTGEVTSPPAEKALRSYEVGEDSDGLVLRVVLSPDD